MSDPGGKVQHALDRATRALRLIAADDLTALPRQAQWRAFCARRALIAIDKILAEISPHPTDTQGNG